MRIATLLLLTSLSARAWAIEIQAPETAAIDTKVPVRVVGADPRSFVSIVAPQTPEGQYQAYQYTRKGAVEVPAPDQTGQFEIRLLAPDRPYATLARRPIQIVMPKTSLSAPATVPIATEFKVDWSGPSQSNEFITLVPLATPERAYKDYKYARGDGSGSVTLTTPAQPGEYELRYMTGSKRVVIGRRALTVGDLEASIEFAPNAGSGSRLSVAWRGPGHARDFITIVDPEAELREYGDYTYTKSSPLEVLVPEAPGEYEVRYLTADSARILARGKLIVGAATASLAAAEQVEADTELEVRWTGPNNDLDYIAITKVGDPKTDLEYSYSKRGNPALLGVPKEPGEYELHYLTGRDHHSLAKRALTVTPAAAPGNLRVLDSAANAGGSARSIELILDASGSMLQKMGAQARIELARNALDQLIQHDIAAGTPVALRVFGHKKADACDTELVSPLRPLDRAALGATVRALAAKNLAKTPIAQSLAEVANDLAGVEGQALVILVTDGEETCDGDPAAEITRLRQQGFELVVNIVGFAIDEYALQREFQAWAELGGGSYFNADDGAALATSVRQALRTPFGVYLDNKRVASGVAGGDALRLKPGRYEVRIANARQGQSVEIRANQESVLKP